MSQEVLSLPKLFFKRPTVTGKTKRQVIADLIADSSAGLTLTELAAALDSPTNSVSVMICRINRELIEQGWKISSSTDLELRQRRRGAPGRRYRLVRL